MKQRTGRAAEIGLLTFAAVIVSCALIIVELNQDQQLSWDLAWYGGGYLLALLITHLLVRWLAPYADPVLMPVAALLNGLGLVMIHRLDLADVARAKAGGDPTGALEAPLQLMWTAVALGLFLLVLLVVRDHTKLQNYAYTLALAGVVFLAIPAILPARYSAVNGAKIWIKIPGLFSIQPSEFAKIALIIFCAAFLSSRVGVLGQAGKRFLGLTLPRMRDLGPLALVLVIALGILVRGNDLGTSLLLFGIVLVMLYLATSRISWVIICLLAFGAGCVLMYQLFPHFKVRVDIWLHPFADPSGSSYQLVQSLFGLGTGGIFGTGLGAGRPDLVPFASTDFITAAFGEELGLVGLTVIIVLYMLLTSRGIRTGIAARDKFGALLAGGLAFSIALQVFIIVGGVTRLIPLTGLTTPFLSYGGSSLLANYMILALLVRISDSSRRPPPPPPVLGASSADDAAGAGGTGGPGGSGPDGSGPGSSGETGRVRLGKPQQLGEVHTQMLTVPGRRGRDGGQASAGKGKDAGRGTGNGRGSER
ncbi:FtsW/RodA/SpoVE family cell cycle protein [Nakamurella aerolata]|uniref:FtsW/RodA/SpoVE family cell cycle protein n=1 Tax=Nakamurella aerolata TaxID=1656892 RepID=UPI0031B5F968